MMNAPTKAGGKKTLAFGSVSDFAVLVHDKSTPSDEEWAAWLDFATRYLSSGRVLRSIVVTDGGAPTPTQRQAMNKRLSDVGTTRKDANRTAIVTASAYVRGVVTALGWFSPGLCAYAPDRLDDVMDYLEVPQILRAELVALIKSLQNRIGGALEVSSAALSRKR